MDSNSTDLMLFNKIHYGRQDIVLDYDEVTPDNVIEVMQKALPIHAQNRKDCEYLIKYFLGDQDILYRQGSYTSEINNKTVVNYAFPITRQIVGYTFAGGIELVQKDMNKKEAVNKLSDYYSYENAYYVDICTGIYNSICGVGYQITLPNNMITKDNTPDIPFVYEALDPRDTFVVKSSAIGHPQIMSCIIGTTKDRRKLYTIYTDKYRFTIVAMDKRTLTTINNPIGIDPITMIENSLFLTGDWEQAISVMNASNMVASDALNDIESTIKALLVVIGAEFDDSDGEQADIKKVKKNRILTLTSQTGTNLDAKFISSNLDSTSVQNIRDYLEDARNVITGIPDRSANSSGGDTGTAVLNRDGWTDIEIVARLKELFFKKGKKKQLAVGIKILQMLDLIDNDLKVLDVEPVIGRHTTDNLSTKTTAFSTLVATGELATIDCLELSGLTNKTREMVERGEQAKKKRQEEAIKTNNQNGNNPNDNKNNDDKNNKVVNNTTNKN